LRARGARSLVVTLSFAVVLVGASVGTAKAEQHAELGPKERKVDDAICDDFHRADRWNTGWAIAFSLAAVGSAGLATFAPREWFTSDTRASLYLTAAKATVAATFKLVKPLRIDVAGLCRPGEPTSARARHALLVEAADRERNALLPNIFGGLLLNSVSLLYLGWGRGDWEGAWISFGVGSAVSVASTLTAPTHSWLLRRRLDKSRSVAAVPMLGGRTRGVALVAIW
jgi:hypothetical protein